MNMLPGKITIKVEWDDKVLEAEGFGDVQIETKYEEELIDLGWGIMYGPGIARYFLHADMELTANDQGNFGTIRMIEQNV